MSFSDFGFREDILKAVAECGYAEPTPIQAKAMPHILMSRDVVGLAQTGTGKTAGFILPMLEILSVGRAKARMPRSLVLVPTRELAAQVAENFDEYGKYLRLSKAVLTGGSSMNDQMKLLDRGVDVLIATPGRLLDLFQRGSILLSDLKILVVDEADRMLDMGFIPDIDKIISLIPPSRQTLLFSATMPPEIQKLAEKYMYNPVQVEVARRSSVAETVEQFLVDCSSREKHKALLAILGHEKVRNAFIFINRKRDVPKIYEILKTKGYAAGQMHGDMAQTERNRILQKFKDGEILFLVCSDVAARGLDIEAVSHVINYDVPVNAEDYVHRIGRTGRAGLSGRAWTIATGDDEKQVAAIEKLLNKAFSRQALSGLGSETAKGAVGRSEKEPSGGRERVRQPERRPARGEKGPPKNESPVVEISGIVDGAARREGGAGRREVSPRDRNRPEERDSADVTGFGEELPAFFRAGGKPLS